MSERTNPNAKATVHDIAREAGVSRATVDRVLNNRPGVRKLTIERVQYAIEKLGFVRDLSAANLARKRTYQFVFMLPDGKGQFLIELRNSIEEAAQSANFDRVQARIVLVSSRDQNKLTQELNVLQPENLDGLAIMANETPIVRDTIARLKAGGVAIVSLVADQPNSERDHFVGFDNVAAGRTAATLIGGFVGEKTGKIGVVVTSLYARDMIERRWGFDALIAERFPNLTPLPSIEAFDSPELSEELTLKTLEENDDIVAIYSVGSSVKGIAAAIKKHNAPRHIVCVDHELTDNSRALLESRIIDAVITQNTGHLARSALRVLRARCDNAAIIQSQEHIRIEVLLLENLPAKREQQQIQN